MEYFQTPDTTILSKFRLSVAGLAGKESDRYDKPLLPGTLVSDRVRSISPGSVRSSLLPDQDESAMNSLPLLILMSSLSLGYAEGFKGAFFEPNQPPRALQAMAHRGASRQAPENTAAALEFSIADSVEWIEVDVRLTRDGHHVLFHDAELSNKTNGAGRISDRTLDEIRTLDNGTRFARRFQGQKILTLAEALTLAKGRVNLYLDAKAIDPALLVQEVRDAKMERQVVVYGGLDLIRSVRDAPGATVPVMTKWRPKTDPDPARWADEIKPDAVEIDAVDITTEAVRAFHARGIKVEAKTLGETDDRPDVWARVSKAGVDWIQTDRAEEVVATTILRTIGPPASRRYRTQVSLHRGASRYAPENTLVALEKAVSLCADLVEFDVRTTRDGGFVLLHDGRLNRTTSGAGPVREATLGAIEMLDAGSWFGSPHAGEKVPTLDRFLDSAGNRVELYFDAKDIAPDALARVLDRHGLTERAVVYQSSSYLEKLKNIAPKVRRMPPLGDPDQIDVLIDRVKPYAFDTRWSILSKALIDRCHAGGVRVFSDALGLHETVEAHEAAIKAGIDLIQTDHPLRFLRALERAERGPSGPSEIHR